MGRRVLVAALMAAVVPLGGWVTTPPAAAAEPIVISGTVAPSSTLEGHWLRFCRVGSPDPCEFTYLNASNEFSRSLDPGTYDVRVFVKLGPARHSSYLRQRLTLTESDQWQLQLPELVRVRVSARDAGGAAFPGAKVSFLGGDPAEDVTLSAQLPGFDAVGYYPDVVADTDGRATVLVLPDARLGLHVGAPVDDVYQRFPLDTPTRTSVEALSATSVVAQALPLATMELGLVNADGDSVAGQLTMQGRWGRTGVIQIPSDGPADVRFPVSRATVKLTVGGSRDSLLPQGSSIEQSLRAVDGRSLTLTLPRAVRLRGTVMDADTATAVSGALVSFGGPSDPADPAVLHPSLDPATIVNGIPNTGWWRYTDTSDESGHVSFWAFPDSNLTTETVLQQTGAYRTQPALRLDASRDLDFTPTLPKSVTISAELTDHDGNLSALNSAALEVSATRSVPFAAAEDGRLTMVTNPGTARVTARLTAANLDVTRVVEVNDDVLLTMQAPETHRLTVVTVAYSGHPQNMSFEVTGSATVLTESGQVDAVIRARGWTDSTQRGSTVMVPSTTAARVAAQDPENYWASISNLTVLDDRTVVLQNYQDVDGAGAPYVLMDQVEPFIRERVGTVSWHDLDAKEASFVRTVLSPFGQASSTSLIDGGLPERREIQLVYAKGVTTCFGATAERGAVTGPHGMAACRTRPLDDRAFFASGDWQRVEQEDAYSGSYRRASDRGSRLSLGAIDLEVFRAPGGWSLLARKSPNAGTVRLMMYGQWISAPVSLQGEATGSELVPIPLRFQAASLKGKLHVVVVSDGKPVRVDGIAIPVAPPGPLLPPL